ncbi:MAG TPA: S9 family peptidase [Candidatus Angelobacter sp.]|jgi:acylaminoacyl-peptidase|nr:S9 family peptidase [Candidatus Angelobacter sp.]
MSKKLLLLLITLLFITAAMAQQKRPGLSVEDIFNLQSVSDPQISPDGQRIVYVRGFADIMTDRRCSNLWIINADGSNNRPLTSGVHNDNNPRWSPDGTRVAYVSDDDGHAQIYVRWMDSGQTARITSLQAGPSRIEWSPDGKEISFASFVPAEPVRLMQMPKAPTGAKWAEQPVIYDKSVYRFNAAGYLKPGYTHVFVVSAEGGTPRQITSGNFHFGGPGVNASTASWSPDSKFLLVSANRHDDYEYNPADTEVYRFSLEDGSVKALTDRRGPDSSPVISPDGKHIAYVGYDDKFQGYQVVRLYLMNSDGSGSHEISSKLDRDARDLVWASDSSGVYFAYDDQGDTKLAFYSVTGQLKQLASHVTNGGNPFSVSHNGTIAMIYTVPEHPGEIAVMGANHAGAKVITDVNHDLLAQRRLGKVEEIWFNSSVDNRKIQGWVMTPPDFDPGKKYPLVLEIHGGPFANYGDRFDLEKQLMAAHGYVVVFINPRGSTSYGETFGNLIHHAYPGDDFFDLNSAVDAVIAKGYIDPDNVFVTGGSGGGVLTCWMIGRSNRFKAAASLYPVIDWFSFALTADIPILVTKYWFPGNPWEYPDQYAKRSVISLVKNVKTPTLLMTGEADYRTPISQAEEYYEALKLQHVETVLVRVPDEPHGIAQRPSHHMAKLLLIMGWFDKHRGDGSHEGPVNKTAGN